jgi:hypothetical protein
MGMATLLGNDDIEEGERIKAAQFIESSASELDAIAKSMVGLMEEYKV